MSGHEVAALLDTGSEVTTVTETWAAAHLQDRSLQQAFLTLRAVNGAEVPYSGILLVDIDILGKRCPDVPVLVVKEPTELSMQQRKRRLPVLVGMNVLRSCFPPEPASASEVPSCLQAVVREVRLQQRTTTQGVARTTSRCHTPAVVSTLLTPLPVSCPLTTPHHYIKNLEGSLKGEGLMKRCSLPRPKRPCLRLYC